jgi:poly-gamma-glutamate synthesis protein (capsule biosynthesis protein)
VAVVLRTRRALLAAGLAGAAGCLGTPSAGGAGRGLDAGDVDARVGFAGDAMLGRGVADRWADREPAGVWGDALDRLRALDGLLLNLECCVSAGGERWPDKTYYFRSPPSFAVPALRAAGVATASLANNHVLDFGAGALRDTRAHLADAGIAHAGAGPTLRAALEPAVAEVGGLTVATVAFTDRFPAYGATAEAPGSARASLDPGAPPTRALVGQALTRARAVDPDLLVASLHWGPNWETAPDATQRAFARWLVDRGVDVVHGHSAHVLQGVELYRGRPILYDAGDVVDDYLYKDGFHNKRSAVFELVVADGGLERLRVVPTVIREETARLATDEAAAWVRRALGERSRPFGTAFEREGAGLAVGLGAGER